MACPMNQYMFVMLPSSANIRLPNIGHRENDMKYFSWEYSISYLKKQKYDHFKPF
jgi:hypothetical protein